MTERAADNIKPVAGVSQEIFLTLPKEDQAFLSMIDRLGYSLDQLHEKAIRAE